MLTGGHWNSHFGSFEFQLDGEFGALVHGSKQLFARCPLCAFHPGYGLGT
jgi:hypothetical protein